MGMGGFLMLYFFVDILWYVERVLKNLFLFYFYFKKGFC